MRIVYSLCVITVVICVPSLLLFLFYLLDCCSSACVATRFRNRTLKKGVECLQNDIFFQKLPVFGGNNSRVIYGHKKEYHVASSTTRNNCVLRASRPHIESVWLAAPSPLTTHFCVVCGSFTAIRSPDLWLGLVCTYGKNVNCIITCT